MHIKNIKMPNLALYPSLHNRGFKYLFKVKSIFLLLFVVVFRPMLQQTTQTILEDKLHIQIHCIHWIHVLATFDYTFTFTVMYLVQGYMCGNLNKGIVSGASKE